MKLGIVGLGVVGEALKRGFSELNHIVKVHDIKLKTNYKDLRDCDIIFLALPTPIGRYGECDITLIDKYVGLYSDLNYKGVICIKSTSEPGTLDDLAKKFKKIRLSAVPEFLRERKAYEDFTKNHDILAIGTKSKKDFNLIKKAHGIYPKNVIHLKPSEAETLKYYSNTLNALKIVFANTFYEICKETKIDYKKILKAYSYKNIKNNDYLDANENLRGYSGPCLPKDVIAMDRFVQYLRLDLQLFHATNIENAKFKPTILKGMRKN